jgi:basic membrane protein A
VAAALDAAHAAGLVHRDVKPANILVDARPGRPDHVYLSDFGVSKGAVSSVSLTGTGQFLGTPDYSAPEQIEGRSVDGRTDQYALACVAYQMLAGAVPFQRDQGLAVLLAHLSAPPPSLSSRRPDLPQAADDVLARGMAKVPEERYGSCQEFADALREALGLAPYYPRESAAAPDHPPAEITPPLSELPGPAAAGTGTAAVLADLAAAATPAGTATAGPPVTQTAPSPTRSAAGPAAAEPQAADPADLAAATPAGTATAGPPVTQTAPSPADSADGPAAEPDTGPGALPADGDQRATLQPRDDTGTQLSRRVRSARPALWGAAVLAVAGTVTAVILSSTPSTPTTSPSTPATSLSAAATSSRAAAAAAAAGKILGCLVTDTGGIDDRSFNASAWAGMQAAAAANPNVTVKYLQSTTQSDYTPNINTFISQKCNLIVTVGFLMGAATEAAAKANPTQKFAIVDCSYASGCLPGTQEPNIDQLTYNTVQDGFLGGYLAAGMTKTGRVATFGGIELPTVTIYMDGYWDGVQYYNQSHGTSVQVLGWNEQTQKGSFTGDFTDQTKGQTLTQTFISEGADVIFPVAGNVGLGAAQAVQSADQAAGSDKVNMEWVDVDGCVSASQYCPYFITSVEKGIVASVKSVVLSVANGSFQGGTYIGTLANGGAVLAPFHDFADKVPASLQAELQQVTTGIENGSIQTLTQSPV